MFKLKVCSLMAPLFLSCGEASAAVVAVRLPERVFMGPPQDIPLLNSYYFDLNNDGATDVFFGTTDSGLTAATSGTNALLRIPPTPPNHNGHAAPLVAGMIIGADPTLLSPELTWHTGGSGMIVCMDTGCAGTFLNRNAAVGVRFEAADGTHFGYVDFEADPWSAGGWITGWGYESEPGKSILTGAVPEPSAAALLGAALAPCLLRRQRLFHGPAPH